MVQFLRVALTYVLSVQAYMMIKIITKIITTLANYFQLTYAVNAKAIIA